MLATCAFTVLSTIMIQTLLHGVFCPTYRLLSERLVTGGLCPFPVEQEKKRIDRTRLYYRECWWIGAPDTGINAVDVSCITTAATTRLSTSCCVRRQSLLHV